ncbi:hypothetical protein O0I10_011623 [Lichtheimia ornata]|uniref:F-box domain-containing protein n=1 Tax=Lichtheimia ornata TaxID=688661 RepID=A0AAD7UTD0_9FUNG|nr:uncharacterized protein O0I10_011623 [Lichtheimia ornata]KAJ8652741.1 hypothetical protein O0I10_011623 [Lichtheimia ornata]
MPAQSWEDLVSTLESAQRSGSHAPVIRHATSTYDHLLAKLVKILEIRVRSFVEIGEFEKAQEDATKIQQWKPESVDGYLLSGNIYAQYGYHRKAMDVYNKGLASVSTSNPDYQRLVQTKSASVEQSDKTIDFIKRLPLEPVANILRMVVNDEPFDCANTPLLHVSKTWNEKILQLVPLHFRITDASCLDDGNDLITYESNVQSLDFLYSVMYYKRLFKKATFSNLKRLYLEDLGPQLKNVLAKLVRYYGRKLEQLVIEAAVSRRGDSILDLDCIRVACPKLISFTCRGAAKMDIAFENKNQWSSLRSLAIHVELTNSSQSIIDMFERLPYIEDLSLSSFVSSRTLVETVPWCPYLRYLALGPETILPTTYVDRSKVGLQVLDLSITETSHVLELYSTKDIASILHAHASTLVACRLHLLDLRPQPEGLQLDADICFERLVRFDSIPMESPHHIAITDWIITRAPNLQEVHLDPSAINENIIQALIHRQRLHTLNVRVNPDHVPLLQTLAAHHRDLGAQSSSLTTLELCITESWEEIVDDLLSISQLPCIKTLKLNISGVSDRTLARFINAFATTSPQLECFKLISSDPNWVFYETLAELSQFPNLRHLMLEGYNFKDGIRSSLQCRHLQTIELCTHDAPSMRVASSLKDVFPFLKVSPRRQSIVEETEVQG